VLRVRVKSGGKLRIDCMSLTTPIVSRRFREKPSDGSKDPRNSLSHTLSFCRKPRGRPQHPDTTRFELRVAATQTVNDDEGEDREGYTPIYAVK
jgi:hypothetical protein